MMLKLEGLTCNLLIYCCVMGIALQEMHICMLL